MNEAYMEKYVSERLPQLKTVCRTLWEYISHIEVREWLDFNFKNDIEGRYYSLRILLHTIYYGKKDIENLLHYGIYEKLLGRLYKEKLINEGNIHTTQRDAEVGIKKLRDSTFFIPLVDSDKPSESGNTLISDIVHKLEINKSQVAFPKDIVEESICNYKTLAIIDDCLGSGQQLSDFWNSDNMKKIKGLCEKYTIDVYFIVLVAYEDNIINLQVEGDLLGLKIIICDKLTNKNRIFSNESIVWRDKTELEGAKEYFRRLMEITNTQIFGHADLDFAVILYNRVPDWSLPIFWIENAEWRFLIKRKNSKI